MAINNVKKAIFFVPQNIYENFLAELKETSCVEIISSYINTQSIKEEFFGFKYEEIKDIKNKLETSFNILSRLQITTSNFKLESLNIPLLDKNLKEDIQKIKFIYNEIEKLDTEIKNIQLENQNLENKKTLLLPFEEVNINFKDLTFLKYTRLFFLKFEKKKYEAFLDELQNINLATILWSKKINQDVFILVLFYRDEEKRVMDLAKKCEAHFYEVPSQVSNTIKEELSKIEDKLKHNNQKIFKLKEEIKKIYEDNREILFSCYFKILELEDFISTQQYFKNTKYFKIINCWVPEKFLKKLKTLTEKFSKDISVIFLEPDPNEDIPIVLENKKIVQPYEFITKLYGYPKFGTIDPTEYLAPFFTIFFSLCVSDIFYGFLLFLLWLFLRKKVPKESEYYSLVVLFKYLGISSVLIGFTLDSFLGFSVFKNFKFPLNLSLFDPLNRPIDMLKFTFLLGFIQVIFGLSLNFFKSIKDKDFLSSVDNISWILFITAFAPTVYKLFFPKDVPAEITKLSSKISLFLFIFIVFFQSRDIKPIFLKPINFFVKAYNTIGFYADMLSYSRILALALASSAIAQTINMLVTKLLNAELFGIKFLEPSAAIILFIGGHIFNFVMAILGAIVHSARLQYLEFFSKFFVAGGRPIKFFSPLTKH